VNGSGEQEARPLEQFIDPFFAGVRTGVGVARIAGHEPSPAVLAVDGLSQKGDVDVEAAAANRTTLMVGAGVFHDAFLTWPHDTVVTASHSASMRNIP